MNKTYTVTFPNDNVRYLAIEDGEELVIEYTFKNVIKHPVRFSKTLLQKWGVKIERFFSEVDHFKND